MRKVSLLYMIFLAGVIGLASYFTFTGALFPKPREGDQISIRHDSIRKGSRRTHFLGGHRYGK